MGVSMYEQCVRQKIREYEQQIKEEESALILCKLNEKEHGYSKFKNEIDHLVEIRIYEGMIVLLNDILSEGGKVK